MHAEFIIHGVPQGHQVWDNSSDKYYETFYGNYDLYGKAKSVLVVEVRNNPGTLSSYYSFVRSQNVLAAGGRPGSYFGMSLRVDGSYCADVYSLFQLFELTFNQFISNHILKASGEAEQYAQDTFESAGSVLAETKRYFLSQVQSHLANSFEDLDKSFTRINPGQNALYNVEDVNSEAFFNAMRVDGKVLISRDYPSKDSLLKTLKVNDSQQKAEIRNCNEVIEQLTKENTSLKQYRELYNRQQEDFNKAKERLQRTEAELSNEKKTAAALKHEVASLTKQNEYLHDSSNIQRIASNLERSMQDFLPILKSVATKIPQAVSLRQHIITEPSPKKSVFDRIPSKARSFLYFIAAVLALFLILFFILRDGSQSSSNEVENNQIEAMYQEKNLPDAKTSQNSETQTSTQENAYSNLRIDVKDYSGGDLIRGQSYTISILGYSGQGEWEANGFYIQGLLTGKLTDPTIKAIPTTKGEIHIFFKVDGKVVKTRVFKVKE